MDGCFLDVGLDYCIEVQTNTRIINHDDFLPVVYILILWARTKKEIMLDIQELNDEELTSCC